MLREFNFEPYLLKHVKVILIESFMWCFVAERGKTHARASALHDKTGTPHPPLILEDTHESQFCVYLLFIMQFTEFKCLSQLVLLENAV